MMVLWAGTSFRTHGLESMRIVGEWQAGDDGLAPGRGGTRAGRRRCLTRRRVFGRPGAAERCSVQTYAADWPFLLALVADGSVLLGIGGVGASVLVKTVLVLTQDNGGKVHMPGEFAAFTDPAATDLSILGRDVLNHFDVIQSRRRNEVLLLAHNHQYRVEQV